MTLLSAIIGAIFFILVGLVFSVSGLGLPSIEHYKDGTPKMDIRAYFNGKLIAFGSVQDITGRVVTRFTATIEGSWNGNNGTMAEVFTYEDGSIENRTWHFTVAEDGRHFTGTANDVEGEAKGEQLGNAVFARYTLERTLGERKMKFAMDDRLYQVDDTHMVNQIRMRKFGVTVATLNIAFYKVKP